MAEDRVQLADDWTEVDILLSKPAAEAVERAKRVTNLGLWSADLVDEQVIKRENEEAVEALVRLYEATEKALKFIGEEGRLKSKA